MEYSKTKPSAFIFGALLLATFLATPGTCAKCCLTQIMNIDSITAIMADSGFTNVVVNSKTCDKVGFSAVYMGLLTITATYNALENSAIETRTITSVMGQSDTAIDTAKNACGVGVKKNTLKIPSVGLLYSYPNPFQGKVTVAFYNPSHNACIQIFNTQGAIVAQQGNIHASSFTWKPVRLTQGRYVVKVTTGKKSVMRPLIYLK